MVLHSKYPVDHRGLILILDSMRIYGRITFRDEVLKRAKDLWTSMCWIKIPEILLPWARMCCDPYYAIII